MRVIKRNGTGVNYDESKIINAISSANKEMTTDEDRITETDIMNIVKAFNIFCNETKKVQIEVEEIQDFIEKELMKLNKYNLMKAYIIYRYEQSQKRHRSSFNASILSLVNGTNVKLNDENSNKDSFINSVQRDYIAGEVSKDITRESLLPKDIVKAHDDGLIHFHDADYFLQFMHNCSLVNLEDMLQNNTVISSTLIETPHSFSTACNIATQCIAQVASSSFGGQSITMAHLAPFVQMSRLKFRKMIRKMLETINIELDEEKINTMAESMVHYDVEKGIQTIQYQIQTLLTTNGQAPFLSVFLWINEVPEGQTRDDLALIIEEVLKQRIIGVKNEKGVYVSPAFPKLLYVTDENNIRKGTKYWYLTELAAKCSIKRMVPDYISAKKMREYKEGNVFPCMGCVAGEEVVAYKFNGKIKIESFERMWNTLSDYYDVKEQNPGDDKNLYMDTPFGVEIYDSKKGFVKNERVIRNTSTKWVNIKFSNGRQLTCTEDHPFETENRGVVYARNLRSDDIIYTNRNPIYEGNINFNYNPTAMPVQVMNDLISPIDITFFEKEQFSYDVTTESEHFEVSGIYSHNCRSSLAPWKNENGEYQFYGRFNGGVVTINLVDVACSSNGDMDKFWKILDERLELCHRALLVRYDRLKQTTTTVAPILWEHGALARLEKGSSIAPLLKDGRTSFSLGYAGLAETVYRMLGKSHTDEEAKPFAIAVMQRLNDACEEWKLSHPDHLGFSVYGTPLESTTYKFAECLKKRFGVIEGVTDKNYITNSYHVRVTEEIDAMSKLAFESEFQTLSLGGAISYIEVPNMSDNEEAVLSTIQFMYDNIIYAEFNTKSDYCHICGYDGEILIVKDNDGKLVWECPVCKNRDQHKMNVTRRTCGYLGTQYWNQGRTQEISERVLHL